VKKLGRKRKREVKKTFTYGEFGPKAVDVIDNSDAFLNILTGAIRSSKTIDSTIAWLQFVSASPHDEFMQSGKTRTSLYRNVLRDELSMLEGMGVDYEHRAGDGYLRIDDKYIWLMGFNNESVVETVRGMTIAGWNADETNTYPKNAVEEALDRLSLEGSRAYWTMNPDSPYHYINKEYITNKELLESGTCKVWQFNLWDNPNLPQEYIDRILIRYPKDTVQYKRKVLGLWVIAEGCIYDHFLESRHTFTDEDIPYATYDQNGNFKSLDYDYYVIGTDWGSGTVTVFGLFGIKRSPKGNHYHLLDEFYFDTTQHTRGLKASEYANNAIDMLNFHGQLIPINAFFTPHDASTLRNELNTRHWLGQKMPVRTYMPDTLADIESIKEVIADDRFMINKERCPNTLDCMMTYAWDPKAQKVGKDAPLKVGDHPADMIRGPILGTRSLSMGNDRRSSRAYTFSKAGRDERRVRIR